MKAAEMLVFDGQLTSAVNVAFTPDSLHDALGTFDQLAIMVVANEVVNGTAGLIGVSFYHSSDGRCWLEKNGNGVVSASGALPLNPTTQAQYFGFDDGSTPSLALVRLRIALTSATSALVRVYVIGRNVGTI